jgi:menaquinone-9 beta-reductase
MQSIPGETEVLIVGGGPAGLAAAIAARHAGLEVTLAETSRPPIDKACGEGIMPDGIAALAKLGVNLEEIGAAPFTGIRFISGGSNVAARFPNGVGLGVRRTALHELLARRAADAGATLLWGARVSGLAPFNVLVNGSKVRSRWIIGADGHNSRVRRWAGLKAWDPRPPRFGFRRHFAVAPWSEFVEVYWADRGQVTVTPISESQVCVAIVTRDPQFRFAAALKHLPGLAERLSGARATTPEQGAISATRRLRCVSRGHVALIGEASGSVDALTGEGLSIAFQQSVTLAQALAAGDLSRYEIAHRRVLRLPRLIGRTMLSLDRHPWLQDRALQVLSQRPAVFHRLLAVHTGALSPRHLGVHTVMQMGWGLLTV